MPATQDMFTLRRLDWKSIYEEKLENIDNLEIHRMVVMNNFVILAIADQSCILRLRLDSTRDFDVIEISNNPKDSVHEIFLDSTGVHLIVSLKSGNNYYIHARSTRPKHIQKLQCLIDSVAFNDNEGTEGNTKSILIGSATGQIYEVRIEKGQERYCQLVYQFEVAKPVTSLRFEKYNVKNEIGSDGSSHSSSSNVKTELLVLALCANPTRLYHFRGGPTFQQLFDEYKKSTIYTELAGGPKKPSLVMGPQAKHYVLCGNGVYEGTLVSGSGSGNNSGGSGNSSDSAPLGLELNGSTNDSSSSSIDDSINGGRFLPFPPQLMATLSNSSSSSASSKVIASSLVRTQHHLLILFDEGREMVALSALDGALVQSYSIYNTVEGQACSLLFDFHKSCFWLYSRQNVFQISVVDEDRNVWRNCLLHALQGHTGQYEAALMTCPKDKRHMVYAARAEDLLVLGEWEQAASAFAQTEIPFEDVVLRLVGALAPRGEMYTADGGQMQELALTDGPRLSALRVYIQCVIDQTNHSDLLQKSMLATWMCELYLHQIVAVSLRNQSTSNAALPQSMIVESEREREDGLLYAFEEFLRRHHQHIERNVALEIFGARAGVHSHVRRLVLLYAELRADYELTLQELLVPTDVMTALERQGKGYTEKSFIKKQKEQKKIKTAEQSLEELESCLRAIRLLDDAPFDRVEYLIYEYCPRLIVVEPEKTVEMLLRKPHAKAELLIPSLHAYADALDEERTKLYQSSLMKAKEQDDNNGGGVDDQEEKLEREKIAKLAMNTAPLGLDFRGEETNFAILYLTETIRRYMKEGLTVSIEVNHALLHLLCRFDNDQETLLLLFFRPKVEGFFNAVAAMYSSERESGQHQGITDVLSAQDYLDNEYGADPVEDSKQGADRGSPNLKSNDSNFDFGMRLYIDMDVNAKDKEKDTEMKETSTLERQTKTEVEGSVNVNKLPLKYLEARDVAVGQLDLALARQELERFGRVRSCIMLDILLGDLYKALQGALATPGHGLAHNFTNDTVNTNTNINTKSDTDAEMSLSVDGKNVTSDSAPGLYRHTTTSALGVGEGVEGRITDESDNFRPAYEVDDAMGESVNTTSHLMMANTSFGDSLTWFILKQPGPLRVKRFQWKLVARHLIAQDEPDDHITATSDTSIPTDIDFGIDPDEKRESNTSGISGVSRNGRFDGCATALQLMRDSNGILRIGDILPFLPDSTDIDLFREDMCSSLEQSSADISRLRSEIAELEEATESINREIKAVQDRGYSMQSNQRCYYCNTLVLSSPFYLYPCSHAFHADCVMERLDTFLSASEIGEVRRIRTQIQELDQIIQNNPSATTSNNTNNISNSADNGSNSTSTGSSTGTSSGTGTSTIAADQQREQLYDELDTYIACECPLCGDLMIESVAKPLLELENSNDLKAYQIWDLTAE